MPIKNSFHRKRGEEGERKTMLHQLIPSSKEFVLLAPNFSNYSLPPTLPDFSFRSPCASFPHFAPPLIVQVQRRQKDKQLGEKMRQFQGHSGSSMCFVLIVHLFPEGSSGGCRYNIGVCWLFKFSAKDLLNIQYMVRTVVRCKEKYHGLLKIHS